MTKMKKTMSLIMAICMVLSLLGTITAYAAEPTATLVAAICGSTHDFRSSQLMEVVTTGFSEDAILRYTYNRDDFHMTGVLGTNRRTELYPYFFAFSSKDMFSADEDQNGGGSDEPGELVSYYKYFALSSRCWYNDSWYNMTAEDMADMTLYVTVKDVNPRSDTYGETATVSYTGFLEPDLETDIGHVAIALFEGESMRVLDALGHAGVTHITCDNADVSLAVLEDESIADVEEIDNVYYIEGIKTGTTRMEVKIVKTGHCAMHSDQEADSIVDIRVFKKPVPTPTTTTITLTNLEEGVSYTIDGVTQVCEDVDVPLVYTGLTPDTDYEIYVEAEHSFEENGETYHHSAHATVDTRTLVEEVEVIEYTVTYDADGGAPEPADAMVEEGGDHTVGDAPVKKGHEFLGWSDGETTYMPGDVIEDINEDIELVAIWNELPKYENNYAYIFGYSDTVMGAEGPLLRSELSAMIHRLVKQNGQLGGFVYNEADEPDFADIDGQWFRSGIEFMNYKGAFTAAEGEKVYPYAAVTRGEAFKLICLGLGFTEDTTLTVDEYAQLLYAAGYITGDGSGDLKVGDNITRAEFCTMYNRIIGRENALTEDRDGNKITHETYGFTDLDPSEWYYEIMIRATSAYDGEGYIDLELRGIRNVLDDFAG